MDKTKIMIEIDSTFFDPDKVAFVTPAGSAVQPRCVVVMSGGAAQKVRMAPAEFIRATGGHIVRPVAPKTEPAVPNTETPTGNANRTNRGDTLKV